MGLLRRCAPRNDMWLDFVPDRHSSIIPVELVKDPELPQPVEPFEEGKFLGSHE